MNQPLTTDRWKQELLQSAQRCPECGVNWLIFGVEQLESYTCKQCGKSFAIRINANQTGAGESGDGNHERYGKAA
jgi:transcription elongation factor Elf1